MAITSMIMKNDTLAMSANRYMPREKRWIGAAIGAGASILGGIMSASKMKEAQRALDKAHEQNSAYYKRLMSENYLNTSAGQETVRQARELMKSGTNQAAAAQAFGGGTDASRAMMQEKANTAVGNMMSSVASNDTARKDAAGNALAQENSNYAKQTAGIAQQQAANISQAASGLSNAASGLSLSSFKK